MTEPIRFDCGCGRRVVCEAGSAADRERRCSRCRRERLLRADDLVRNREHWHA